MNTGYPCPPVNRWNNCLSITNFCAFYNCAVKSWANNRGCSKMITSFHFSSCVKNRHSLRTSSAARWPVQLTRINGNCVAAAKNSIQKLNRLRKLTESNFIPIVLSWMLKFDFLIGCNSNHDPCVRKFTTLVRNNFKPHRLCIYKNKTVAAIGSINRKSP